MTLLTGCDLLSFFDNPQQNEQNQIILSKIVASNYTQTVEVNATYELDVVVK